MKFVKINDATYINADKIIGLMVIKSPNNDYYVVARMEHAEDLIKIKEGNSYPAAQDKLANIIAYLNGEGAKTY